MTSIDAGGVVRDFADFANGESYWCATVEAMGGEVGDRLEVFFL